MEPALDSDILGHGVISSGGANRRVLRCELGDYAFQISTTQAPRPLAGAWTPDADHVGWCRDHAERLIGRVARHGPDDLELVHCRSDGHRRVTEFAQDGEF
jgi:hypothetical protein